VARKNSGKEHQTPWKIIHEREPIVSGGLCTATRIFRRTVHAQVRFQADVGYNVILHPCFVSVKLHLPLLSLWTFALYFVVRGYFRGNYSNDNLYIRSICASLLILLTAYHFWGAVSHLNIRKRGGGKCCLTKRAVSFTRLATLCQ
jgi:hypothetical protein